VWHLAGVCGGPTPPGNVDDKADAPGLAAAVGILRVLKHLLVF